MKRQSKVFVHAQSNHLHGQNGDEWREQFQNIDEARTDLLCNEHGAVFMPWRAPALAIPILDTPDDMTLVHGAKHQLDLVTAVVQGIGEQQVEPSGPRLSAFDIA